MAKAPKILHIQLLNFSKDPLKLIHRPGRYLDPSLSISFMKGQVVQVGLNTHTCSEVYLHGPQNSAKIPVLGKNRNTLRMLRILFIAKPLKDAKDAC